jgi:FkbM family methyltransferase
MSLRFYYRGLRARFRDQRAELKFLQANIEPGTTVIDCGANKGSYLFSLSRAAGRNGRVIAFEPQPKLASYLKNEIEDCRLRNVVVEQKALSDGCGKARLFVPGGGVSPGASLESAVTGTGLYESYEVDSITLDEYCNRLNDRISAIKIDVEGHELPVLEGGANILREMAPALVVECEQRHLRDRSIKEVLDWILARGYSGWFVHRRRLIHINEFDPRIHQRRRDGDFWNDKDYSNNFLFQRRPV